MRFQITSINHNTIEDFKATYDGKLAKYHIQYYADFEVPFQYAKYVYLTDEETYMEETYVFIELETLEDVLALIKELDEDLVLRNDDGVKVLEIYDGYRE